MTLLNGCNDDTKALGPHMERLLLSAALVEFLTGRAIKDVFEVLQISTVRQKFINTIHSTQKERMEEYVTTLNKLKINTYTELMLKKNGKNNIHFADEIQKNELICLRMLYSMFAADQECDIYCLYWLSKIWLAL